MGISSRTKAALIAKKRKEQYKYENDLFNDQFHEIIYLLKKIGSKEKKIQFLKDHVKKNLDKSCNLEMKAFIYDYFSGPPSASSVFQKRDEIHNKLINFLNISIKIAGGIDKLYKRFLFDIIESGRGSFSPKLKFISKIIIEILKLENNTKDLPLYLLDYLSDKTNIGSKFINEICWIGDDNTLLSHLQILKVKGIISYNFSQDVIKLNERPDIRSENSYVEIICLFKFWEMNKFIKNTARPWKRIKNTFTEHGRDYKLGQLKTQGNSLKDMGFFNELEAERTHPRIIFFEEILK